MWLCKHAFKQMAQTKVALAAAMCKDCTTHTLWASLCRTQPHYPTHGNRCDTNTHAQVSRARTPHLPTQSAYPLPPNIHQPTHLARVDDKDGVVFVPGCRPATASDDCTSAVKRCQPQSLSIHNSCCVLCVVCVCEGAASEGMARGRKGR